MASHDYEKQLADLDRKQAAIEAKKRQVKAKMGKEKRMKENHAKMVLGGAIFGVLKKHDIPEDRKQLEIYGNAVRDVFHEYEKHLSNQIAIRYHQLLDHAESKEGK